ncbi:hypothetical protein EV421DRAFT_1745235 [Armillaria borealis]|uniref:Uncharacterized protein n=1 Tax=Armillaria borealis TaxID=47425 RepID=A0AA39ISJ2_9AGAR|nr:hypothetical protein EV421DRAFT_1745235 [Armillaria borealis]
MRIRRVATEFSSENEGFSLACGIDTTPYHDSPWRLHQSDMGRNIIWSWMYETKMDLPDRGGGVLVGIGGRTQKGKLAQPPPSSLRPIFVGSSAGALEAYSDVMDAFRVFGHMVLTRSHHQFEILRSSRIRVLGTDALSNNIALSSTAASTLDQEVLIFESRPIMPQHLVAKLAVQTIEEPTSYILSQNTLPNMPGDFPHSVTIPLRILLPSKISFHNSSYQFSRMTI